MHIKKLNSLWDSAKRREDDSKKNGAECSSGNKQHNSMRKGSCPHGYLGVYVGMERRRFVIPISYLDHPLFRLLLDTAHQEFGFKQKGGLMVPCEVELFERLLGLIEDTQCQFSELEVQELVNKLNLPASAAPPHE